MMVASLLITLIMLLLGACSVSPGHVAAGMNGVGVWQFVGCYVVRQSPEPDSGVYAIGPFGDLGPGSRVYFKQESADGTAPMVTGRPCE
jgi:hypothetical protein